MTELPPPTLLIVADSPDALIELGGVSILERSRRVAWQIGFREATILCGAIEAMAAHLDQTAWRTANVSLKFRERAGPGLTIGDISDCVPNPANEQSRVFVMFANFYCDLRLAEALVGAKTGSVLIDSAPPSVIEPLLKDSGLVSAGAVVTGKWLLGKSRGSLLIEELASDLGGGRIAAIDAAHQPAYVPDMRREVRPVFFAAPSPEHLGLAERLLLDATQKGVLDFPARVHAPIEKWIVARICRTSITPNQVTLFTGLLGVGVTLLYLFGYLGAGALLALVIGVLDGIDGKLARLRVQTTKVGEGEHTLDYCIEMSWWVALAYHFHATGEVPRAYLVWAGFFAGNVLESRATAFVKRRLGRSLDDVSRFDRNFRFFAGRRNIYTWLFTFCLVLSRPEIGFISICILGIATSTVRVFRALQIGLANARS